MLDTDRLNAFFRPCPSPSLGAAMRIATGVLALCGCGLSWAEQVREGAWTYRAVNGVLIAFPTESRDLLSLACITDDPESPPLYGKAPATGSQWVEIHDPAAALELLNLVWLMEAAGLEGSEQTAFTILSLCLDERQFWPQVRRWQQAKAPPPPKPVPYITKEEIMERFEPFRDRMAETQAVLDEMAQDALDDYRDARRARRGVYREEDDGYPLEPITLPRHDEETNRIGERKWRD